MPSPPDVERPVPENRVRRIVKKLRDYHALGALSHREHGAPLSKWMARWGVSLETVCKIRAFAKGYSQVELDEFCSLRRSNKMPFHWGYACCFLGVPDKQKRRAMQKRAAEENWSVAELQAVVKKRKRQKNKARQSLNIGSPLKGLADRKRGLQRISIDLHGLERRLQQLISDWGKLRNDGCAKSDLNMASAEIVKRIQFVSAKSKDLRALSP